MKNKLLHTPDGVRDLYNDDYKKKLDIQNKLHRVFEEYGCMDIQTPTFEYFDVFSNQIGTTPSKDLYKLIDKDGNTLVLRPDFTPSIARCAAKYFMDKNEPLRFSYLGNAFTNVSNLQGKLKELTQMGAELIGDNSVYADAEMIMMVIDTLRSAGLTKFQVTVGEVEYFKGICHHAGLDCDTEMALRDYISEKNFFAAEELMLEKGISERDREAILQVREFYEVEKTLTKARELAPNDRSRSAIARLEELYELLKQYGVSEYVSFDLGMLSKFHYYTGVIFKAYTYGVGDAIVTGGRYDTLLGRFGKDAPAIGFMVLIDDLMEALYRQGICVDVEEKRQTIYYNKNNYAEKLTKAIELRKQGVFVSMLPDAYESANKEN